jgi:hypothetical protein
MKRKHQQEWEEWKWGKCNVNKEKREFNLIERKFSEIDNKKNLFLKNKSKKKLDKKFWEENFENFLA